MKNFNINEINVKLLFTIIILIHFINILLFNYFNLNFDTYIKLFTTQLEYEVAENITNKLLIIQRIQNFIFIVLISTKLLVIASSIYIILEINDNRISFKEVLSIVLISEFSILFGDLVRFIYFLLNNIESLDQLKYFYPLSILNILPEGILPKYLLFPLKYINIFYLSSFVIITYFLNNKISNNSFFTNLKLVILSYGTLFLIWELLITFLQIMFV